MTTLPMGYQTARPGAAYGRWRLLLGVSAVGTIVLLTSAALLIGLPAMIESTAGSYGAVVLFFAGIAGLHLGFDSLGGYILPKLAGRRHPDAGRFAFVLARGVVIHTGILVVIGLVMLVTTQMVGRWGFVLAGIGAAASILMARSHIARAISEVRLYEGASSVGCRYAMARDEGFTGGVLGVVRAGSVVMPHAWRESLPERVLGVVAQRRTLAISSGAWARGRMAAIGFTLAGLLVASFSLPGALIGTASGVISFSLVFTLWSFAGLLVLPTFSRKSSKSLDRAMLSEGIESNELAAVAKMLDLLQDDEPMRPGWIEGIFHPIPSPSARQSAMESGGDVRPGAWDVARTSIFLSWAGLGLLSRSVHCNCGRPDLWVFLPVE